MINWLRWVSGHTMVDTKQLKLLVDVLERVRLVTWSRKPQLGPVA